MLPSEEGTTLNVSRTFTSKPRPEHVFDCLICAIFARPGREEQLLYINMQWFRGVLVFKDRGTGANGAGGVLSGIERQVGDEPVCLVLCLQLFQGKS